jgi:hypothetical protein
VPCLQVALPAELVTSVFTFERIVDIRRSLFTELKKTVETFHPTAVTDDPSARLAPDLQTAASSSFQHLSIELGFRAIPALGSVAHQFEPRRVSVSRPDCQLRL